MTRDELIEAMARAIFKQQGFIHSEEDRMFEPIEWDELDDPEYPVARAAFRDQAAAAILAIEAQGLAIVPVEASAELAEKAFPILPRAHLHHWAVKCHENANKMRREDYDAMILEGRL